MDLGEVFSKAWKIIWKHKVLWLFGILSGCGAMTINNRGNGAESVNSAVQNPNLPGTWDAPTFLPPSMQRTIEDFIQMLNDIPVWVWILIALAVLIIGIILSVLYLMAGTLGTAGVIKGTSMADEADEDEKPLSFGKIFRALKPYYWKVFIFNIGYRVAAFFVTVILVLPSIFLAICTCGLGFFLFIPISWFLTVVVHFTTIAIIEEDLGIFDAIPRAWQMITKHLGNVILMFIILGIGQIVAGLVVGVPVLISFVPFVIDLIVTGFDNLTVGLIISAVLFLGSLPFMVILSGALRAYITASWTLTFRRLAGEDELSPELISKTTGK